MKRNKFTLLEVLVALVILTLGIAGLLWQLSIAANRAARNAETWELTHDLTSAAEYLLLHGPEAGLMRHCSPANLKSLTDMKIRAFRPIRKPGSGRSGCAHWSSKRPGRGKCLIRCGLTAG